MTRGSLPWTAASWVVSGIDPWRRRVVRRASLAVAGDHLWPGEAATSEDVARLALLRCLWLQRQARQSARFLHRDATTLLARSAVESCLIGCYCALVPEALHGLNNDYVKGTRQLLAHLNAQEPFSPDFLDVALGPLEDEEKLPNLREVANALRNAGLPGAIDLYERIYRPTSALIAHASGLSLSRHVDVRTDRPRPIPWAAWTTTSAVQVADTCVGLLAAVVAGPRHPLHHRFNEYAEVHWQRTVYPVAVVTLAGLRRVQLRYLPDAVRSLRKLRSYCESVKSANGIDAEGKRRIGDCFQACQKLLGFEASDDVERWLVERVGELISAS